MSAARIAPSLLQIAGRIALTLGVALLSVFALIRQHQKMPARSARTIASAKMPVIAMAQMPPAAPRAAAPQNISPPDKTVETLDKPANQTTDPVAQSVAAPAAKPKPIRKHIYFYNDGEYTGSPCDIEYGLVQVSAVIKDGWIVDVKWLQDPEDIDLSRQINHDAMPKLTAEAIKAQNAGVDAITGASFTVLGFRASLGSALAQAKKEGDSP
jgi:uncharacterized protein with FMN-binding domain